MTFTCLANHPIFGSGRRRLAQELRLNRLKAPPAAIWGTGLALMLTSTASSAATASEREAPPAARSNSAAPAPDRPHWSIQLDPLTLALGFVHLQFERTLGDHISVYAGPSVRLWDFFQEEGDPSYYGIGGEAGVRWYLGGEAPFGTWLMVRGVLAQLRSENDVTAVGGYASALIGRKFMLSESWSVSGGAGINYFHYTVDGTGTEGVLPALHTTLGYVW